MFKLTLITLWINDHKYDDGKNYDDPFIPTSSQAFRLDTKAKWQHRTREEKQNSVIIAWFWEKLKEA